MMKLLELFRRLIRIALWGFLGRSSPKSSLADYSKHLWKDSASGLGLRMTEGLRDRWRIRWLKLMNHGQ